MQPDVSISKDGVRRYLYQRQRVVLLFINDMTKNVLIILIDGMPVLHPPIKVAKSLAIELSYRSYIFIVVYNTHWNSYGEH